MKVHLNIAIEPEMRDKIDKLRGEVPISIFIRNRLEELLGTYEKEQQRKK